jgi:hypothetical protein
MSNIIDAIINVVNNPIIQITDYSNNHNRANNMGEALEEYVKDIFADTVGQNNQMTRNRVMQNTFSYLGNQNNPPDSMLINGDAIEVKKIESENSRLALNSSYPKCKLYKNSPMITDNCRNATDWGTKTERDIIFVVGVCKNNILSSLSMVYGMDYAASSNVYERIANTVKTGIHSIQNVEFAETNELGRVNRVDPLGITYLRVRGMWGIENPTKAFDYVYVPDDAKRFNFMAIVNVDKYNSFSNRDTLENLANTNSSLNITDVDIKNPDNPAQLKHAKLITFSI